MAEQRDSDVIDDEMARILRGMTGAQRLRIAHDMFVSARRMLASHLAAEHPDWNQERIERETARRILNGAIDRCYIGRASEEVWQEVLRRS